jgi:hypothetical protein
VYVVVDRHVEEVELPPVPSLEQSDQHLLRVLVGDVAHHDCRASVCFDPIRMDHERNRLLPTDSTSVALVPTTVIVGAVVSC